MKNEEKELESLISVKLTTVQYYKKLLDEIVDQYKEFLDESTTFQILQSHGLFKECLEFAEKLGKYEAIILNYLNEKNYKDAVDRILKYIDYLEGEKSRPDTSKKIKEQIISMIDFILKHSKALILNEEGKLSIKQGGYLKILDKMLQANMYNLIDNNKKIKIVNFLMELKDSQTVIDAKVFLEDFKKQVLEDKGSENEYKKSISNIMIYLLSKIADPKNLEEYLKEKENSKVIDFDLNFAMLLCQQKKDLQRCEIILYG